MIERYRRKMTLIFMFFLIEELKVYKVHKVFNDLFSELF